MFKKKEQPVYKKSMDIAPTKYAICVCKGILGCKDLFSVSKRENFILYYTLNFFHIFASSGMMHMSSISETLSPDMYADTQGADTFFISLTDLLIENHSRGEISLGLEMF